MDIKREISKAQGKKDAKKEPKICIYNCNAMCYNF